MSSYDTFQYKTIQEKRFDNLCIDILKKEFGQIFNEEKLLGVLGALYGLDIITIQCGEVSVSLEKKLFLDFIEFNEIMAGGTISYTKMSEQLNIPADQVSEKFRYHTIKNNVITLDGFSSYDTETKQFVFDKLVKYINAKKYKRHTIVKMLETFTSNKDKGVERISFLHSLSWSLTFSFIDRQCYFFLPVRSSVDSDSE